MESPNTAFALGKYGDCIKELHRLLRRQNQKLSVEEKAEINCNLAFCHLYLELYRKATTYCESALDMDPTSTRALLYKGKAFQRLGKKKEALMLFQEGLKYSVDLQYTAELLSCIRELTEEIRPPDEHMNGLDRDPLLGTRFGPDPMSERLESSSSLSLRESAANGPTLRRDGRSTTPEQKKEDASTSPTPPKPEADNVKTTKAKSVEWKTQVSKQITLDQLDMEVKISCGFALVNQGKYDEAVQLFNEIIELEPNNIKALVGRGSAKAMSKDLRGGETDFSAAIYVEPDVVEAWKRRGQVRVALGKNQLALSDFSRAQHLLGDEDDVDIQKEIGLVYQNKGDHRTALTYLMKAEKILESADNLDAVVARATWNAMGLAYNSLGQPNEAVKVYSKALCLFPDFKEANVNVAQSHKELGMLTEALRHFKKGLDLDPQCVITMNLKSLCEHNAGLITDAYNTLCGALKIEPDNPDSLYMHGICAHGIGKFLTAVGSYDMMLQLQPTHFSYYLRQMALYQWNNLDRPLHTYNPNHDLDPHFKEAWTKRLDPASLPKSFTPQAVSKNLADLNLPLPLTEDMVAILKVSQNYGTKIQYNSTGFLQNVKQQRWAGLAILEMAQTVAQLWQAMRTGDIDGCTVSGQRSSGVTCDHVFGWRDLFDIAVKWRQLSEPQDSVWWIDLLNPEAFAEGFGSQTPMVLAGNRVVRYYPYFLRAFTLIKEHLPEQASLCDEQIAQVKSAPSCEELYAIMNRDFYVVLPCPSQAEAGRVMEGTRLTVQQADPRGYTCSIRTPCTPSRWELFDEELKLSWQQLCDVTTSPRLPSIEKQIDCVVNLVYYWYNMMPLTRGTAACGLVCLHSLILALGYDITAPLPQGMQWDWEAIFLGSPDRFGKVLKTWIMPNLKIYTKVIFQELRHTFISDLPQVSRTFNSIRHVINILNYNYPSLPEITHLRQGSRETTNL